MIRRLNRKRAKWLGSKGAADEGSMVIWLVVAIAAAVIVLLFFYGGYDMIKGLFPSKALTMEAAVQVCKNIGPSFTTTLCDNWKAVTIAGGDQLVNCQYPDIQNKMDLSSQLRCGNTTDYKDYGAQYCMTLFKVNKDYTSELRVNGVLCSSLSCEGLGGSSIASNSSCATGSVERTKGFAGVSGSKCCVTA